MAAAVAGVGVPEADVVVDAGREVVAGVSRDAGPGALEASVATGVGKPEEGWGCMCAEASGMGSEVVHVYPRPVLAWKWRRDRRRVLPALTKSAETPPVAARNRATTTVGFDPGGNMPAMCHHRYIGYRCPARAPHTSERHAKELPVDWFGRHDEWYNILDIKISCKQRLNI